MPAPALPLAHAGHWIVYVLYAVPVIVVVGSILLTVIRERRAAREREGAPQGGDMRRDGATRARAPEPRR